MGALAGQKWFASMTPKIVARAKLRPRSRLQRNHGQCSFPEGSSSLEPANLYATDPA